MERRKFLSMTFVPLFPELKSKPQHLEDDANRPWMLLVNVDKKCDDGEDYYHGLIKFDKWSDYKEPFPKNAGFKLKTRTCVGELLHSRCCFYLIKNYLLYLPVSGVIEIKEMKYDGSDSFYTIRANQNTKCLANQADVVSQMKYHDQLALDSIRL